MFFTADIVKKLFKKFGKIRSVEQLKSDQKFIVCFECQLEKDALSTANLKNMVNLQKYFEIEEVFDFDF